MYVHGRSSEWASVVLQSPICHVQWASLLLRLPVCQCHHQHSHVFDYYKFKIQMREFYALHSMWIGCSTGLPFAYVYDSQRAKMNSAKKHTTIRSSNRRKNLYNNQNELHKTLQFHTNNFQWMIWMFFMEKSRSHTHTHCCVCAEKLRAKTTTHIGALQMWRTVSFVRLICFTYCCRCRCCCYCRYIHQFKQTFLIKYYKSSVQRWEEN